MNTAISPYFFAICANLFFASASLIFSRFSRQYSPLWMNQVKVSVAIFCFAIAFLVSETWSPLSGFAWAGLLSSGLIGLCVGDLFLFRAFSTLGPSRTLVLYGFQPIILGVYGFLFLQQTITGSQFLSILFMIACVSMFLLERNRSTGRWDVLSFAGAFLGIIFDCIGVMLTRTSFEVTPNLGSFQANGIRAIGAILGFILIRPKSYVYLMRDFKAMSKKDFRWVIGASIFGTFVSLSFYLHAIKFAHVATLTAISITSPLWVSIIEHIQQRTLPNRYLVAAFLCFVAGVLCLVV